MRQVNCHIPIKVVIRGRLSDRQVDELGAALIRALSARMEQARRALSEYGHAPVSGTLTPTREAFAPPRLSGGLYYVPSYDSGGKPTGVQVVGRAQSGKDQFEEDWQIELDEAERLAKTAGSPGERAFRARLSLLLNELRPGNFTDDDEFEKFIGRCHDLAVSESDTLKAAADAGRLTTQELLDNFGEAFPNAWADKIYNDFHSDADLDALQKALQSRKKDALSTAASIAAELWARGLPLSIDQARNLKEGDIVGLVLGYEHLKGTPTEVTNNYVRAMFWWYQASAYYSFVKNYKSNVDYACVLLRNGDRVGNPAFYQEMAKLFDDFRQSLPNYERGAISILTHTKYQWFYITSKVESGIGYYYPTEGVDAFWKQIREVDLQIAGTGFNDCLSRAFAWALEREFFEDAGLEVWQGIKENGWKMLFTAAAIFGAQFVPGLNIAVDVVLIIEFGFDVLSTLADLKTALSDAGSAKSVVDMERASAQLGQTLVGTGAKVMLWAIAWAGGKLTGKVAKYRRGKKFIDEHGDTPEVRKALGDARGDVAKAEQNLAAERERLAAEQQRKAAAAAKPPEPPPPSPKPPVKPSEPAATESAGKASDPVKGTTVKRPRTLDDIKRDLQKQGITPEDIGSFRGEAKRLSVALAKQVERLLEHFSPTEVKQLGEYFSKNKIALTDDLVDMLIQKVPQGRMDEFIRHMDIAQVHEGTTQPPGLRAEERTLEKTTTVHPGKPPPTREIVETPGSKILRANLIKRFGEEPLPGYHAHHIIPEKEYSPGLDWMRKRFGKNINDADNGVFLAGRGGLGRVAQPTANPDLTVLHNSYIHAGPSKEYAYTLTRRLIDLHGDQFINEVIKIGEEMRTGKFKIDEIPRGWKTKWEPGMTAPIEEGFQPGWVEE